jgi:hypothetical protein
MPARPSYRRGRTPKHEQFPALVPALKKFVKTHAWEADPRRRTSTARTEGFRLEDALSHLFEVVPGLAEAGMSRTTVQRLFKPPRKGTVAARHYYQVVDARVARKRNGARPMGAGTHFGRAQQKLLQEWMAFYKQVNVTGDDMNIIQVGRPAVSRYHQQRKFYGTGEGPDHDVHDFPNSEMGVKLGGFMVLSSHDRKDLRSRDDFDL